MLHYRQATPEDLNAIIHLVIEYCEEYSFEYDREKIKEYIIYSMFNLLVIIAEDNNKLVGAISYFIYGDLYKKDKILSKKYAIFTSKDYRGKGVGKELLKLAEQDCKEKGAIKFYYTSTKAPDKGYTEVETEFVKEIK